MQQQMSFLDMSCGKTSSALSAPTRERTSALSLKKSYISQTAKSQFLDLRVGNGDLVGRHWETSIPSLGGHLMRNIGESPKDVEESTLWQILEENVPPKYYLSATACRGVLRRTVNRGKIEKMPTLLKIALCLQGRLTVDEIRDMGIFKEGEVLELLHKEGAAGFLDRNSAKAFSNGYAEEQSPTLRAGMLPVVLVFHCTQTPIVSTDVTPCLSAGNSDNGQAMLGICYIDYAAFNQGANAKYDFGVDEKTAFTLTGKGPGAVCYAFQLELHNKVGALNCMHDEQAVVYCIATQQGDAEIMEDKSPTVTAAAGMSGNNQPWICFIGINGEKAGTLDASYYKGCGAREGNERDIVASIAQANGVINVYVRRLTPTECARLQGMPDWWCVDIPHADAPEYKMWGNGMALPNILYVMEGIAQKLHTG